MYVYVCVCMWLIYYGKVTNTQEHQRCYIEPETSSNLGNLGNLTVTCGDPPPWARCLDWHSPIGEIQASWQHPTCFKPMQTHVKESADQPQA